MPNFFDHLRLTEWPFSIVPRPEYCTFLAGRQQLRDDIAFLLRTLTRRDTSSIHVFWSWLGAGKTHALHFMANRAKQPPADAGPVTLLPVYTEFPKGATSFLDLYRNIVPRLGLDHLIGAFLEVSTNGGGSAYYDELQLDNPDLANCLRVLAIDQDAQRRSVAARWLRADRLPVADFRRVGISERLESSERATAVLTVLIRLLNEANRLRTGLGVRVLWLLDEFQRLERTSARAVADVNAGLHSLFNACPVGLTQVLSFSGPPKERSLPRSFSPELRDRIGTTKVIVLPPCQRNEAVDFIAEVLAHFRPPGSTLPSPYFPFSERAVRHIVEYLASRTELRPRALMHIFNAVLEEAEPHLQEGNLTEITTKFANDVLANYVILTDASEDD